MRFVRRQKGVKRPDTRRKSRPLVSASYEVRPDGTHALTVPVYTYNPNNGTTGHSRAASIHKSDERKAQRAQVGIYLRLNEVPRHFRGVRLVRLAPSNPGLDTGGLWAALKAPQDEVAKHLSIDDGPCSPASWEMASEQSKAYGVRVELRVHRAPDWRALSQSLLAERQRVWDALQTVTCECDGFGRGTPCAYCRVFCAFNTNDEGELAS